MRKKELLRKIEELEKRIEQLEVSGPVVDAPFYPYPYKYGEVWTGDPPLPDLGRTITAGETDNSTDTVYIYVDGTQVPYTETGI